MPKSLTEIEKMFDKEFTYGGITGTVAFEEGKDRPFKVKDFYRSQLSALLTELEERVEKLVTVEWVETSDHKDIVRKVLGRAVDKDKVIALIQEYLPISEDK
jgi:hypothetical protein